MPTDGRVHTVDVRDVATALAAATTADVVGETLLIAGDESHQLTQIDTFEAPAAAKGLSGLAAVMGLRPGNPVRPGIRSDSSFSSARMANCSSARSISANRSRTRP